MGVDHKEEERWISKIGLKKWEIFLTIQTDDTIRYKGCRNNQMVHGGRSSQVKVNLSPLDICMSWPLERIGDPLTDVNDSWGYKGLPHFCVKWGSPEMFKAEFRNCYINMRERISIRTKNLDINVRTGTLVI